MQDIPTPQDLEIAAVRAGVSMAQVCKEAGLEPAVFTRWKAGKTQGPTVGSLRKIVAVLNARAGHTPPSASEAA